MISYEQYLPAYHARYYCWRRRQFVDYIAWDIGAKPVVVRPDDYDEQMRPERMPGTELALVDLLVAALHKEAPLTLGELMERTGKSEAGIRRILSNDGRFVEAGKVSMVGDTGAVGRAKLYALRGQSFKPRANEHLTVPDMIEQVLKRTGRPMATSEIGEAIGKEPRLLNKTLWKLKGVRFVQVGGRNVDGKQQAIWTLAEEGSSGHD